MSLVMVDVTLGPCSVVVPISSPPQVYSGRTISAHDDGVWIELTNAALPSLRDKRVILDGPWPSRVLGTVAEEFGNRIRVQIQREVEKDRRAAPRCIGAIDLLYRKAHGDTESWFVTGAAPAAGWLAPDPLMSFSASGLRFEDQAHVVEGDKILIELALPNSPDRFRATATVVRVSEIPADERLTGDKATHRIAVRFDRLGHAARGALIDRALEITRRRSYR